MDTKKVKTIGGAMFFLLLTLYFGNQTLIEFNLGNNTFGVVIGLLLTLGCMIILGDLIKELRR